MKTFHLKRDEKKIEVPDSIINVTIDNNGQVMYSFNNSVKIIPDNFNKSHLKKHYKAVVDYIDAYNQ